MKLEISNGLLMSVLEYLPKFKDLTGKENRARMKLSNKATEKFNELRSDLLEIKSEHPDDEEKQKEETEELFKETAIIDMTEYENYMPILKEFLLNYDKVLDTYSEPGKPSDASIHDYLIDVLEEAEVDHSNNVTQIDGVEDAQFQEVE